MELGSLSGSYDEYYKSRIIADKRINNSAYYLIGKWLIADESKKAFSCFDAIINREDTQALMDSNSLISFGLESQLISIALLKGMIDQLNARDVLMFDIDVKGTISIWLKILNANQLCYVSKYDNKCTTIIESIQDTHISDEAKFWLSQILHVLYNYIFIISKDDFKMLADEAEAYFKRVDADDTTDKTDRNPD